ncbi:hypothetical protein CMsap09_03745 [Clavibacter michiganensis]|uniref:DUF1206 domain-containing protein n=1 Tax=Clavibacter michiganensis TaxID=28447 RepID=A0A251XRE4_9MICO|nr:hypothetical protein CMsap09_03745 [Clavibacter michiganensis]
MSASGAASSLQRAPGFAVAARLGHAVNGLLHLLIGVIAFRLATGGGGGEADQSARSGPSPGRPAAACSSGSSSSGSSGSASGS